MKSAHRCHQEEAFRSALGAHDFTLADAALREYMAWFRSEPRNLEDIRSAIQIFEWGIRVTASRRVKVAEELMRLKALFDAYLPGRSDTETWRVLG